MARLIPLLMLMSSCVGFSPVPVFEAYKGTPPCFRQPVLISAKAALLAFSEGRFNTNCSGTADGPAPNPIVQKRSTDGGATWGALQTVYTGSVDFLTAVYDPTRGRTHLMIQSGANSIYVSSDNDGVTWTAPKTYKFAGTGFKSVSPAVGTGIAISGSLCSEPTCKGAAGRVLLPYICTTPTPENVSYGPGDVKCPGCYSCAMYTDDGGANWKLGASSRQDGSREASFVQLDATAFSTGGATIYASERNMGNSTGMRWHAISFDGGLTFDAGSFAYDKLPDNVCKDWTGVVSGCSRFDSASKGRRLLYTAPSDPTERRTLTPYTSADEGKTWTAGAPLWTGGAAYSSTLQLNATHAALLFENGEYEFAQRISFGVIPTDSTL